MKSHLVIAIKLHRIRFQAEDATGTKCVNCGAQNFLKQYRAHLLMQIGNLPIIEEPTDYLFCQSCKQ